MNAFETFLLDIGFSWTWSRLFPYLFFPLLGLLIWAAFRKRMKRRWVRFTLLVLLIALPFALYFILRPIYEGDFANQSEKVAMSPEFKSIGENRLVVITIPGCPFCLESIERMKVFQAYNPNVKIEYRVCSSRPSDITAYRKAAGNAFPVLPAEDIHQLAEVAGEAFPAFVLTDGVTAKKWSNDHFGVSALDEVNARFH
jgi:hypothetical protein